jgi:hypothetical protein
MFSNELIKRKSLETGISEKYLTAYWSEAENEVFDNANSGKDRDKSKKEFWKKVKELFLNKVESLNIEEARLIMDNRENYKNASVKFLDAIQSGNYVAAKEFFPEVIESKYNNIINSMKDGYLKNMAAKRK